ncbi:MAG: PEGA domain-containing protein [Acidobacteriota bacterium]|nr:PEGA domain-containing protein [Acidobacteriota bacterium]
MTLRLIYIITVLSLGFGPAFAQGGKGGIDKTPKLPNRTPKRETRPNSPKGGKPSSSTVSRPVRNRPEIKRKGGATTAATTGGLSIRVNQPDSEVFLSDQTGNVFEDRDFALTASDGSLVIDELNAGSYVLTIRKKGFRDEQRQVTVLGGKQNAVSVNLVAVAGVLDIKAVPEGTSIEIEGVGNYNGSQNNLLLKPGKYRVYFNRNGYEPEMREIAVNRPGERAALDVTLKPVEIEKLLAAAQSSFAKNDYWAAFRAARRILAVQPENTLANLLAADSLFNSNRPTDSVPFYARAVSTGQSVVIPVRIYNKEKGAEQLPLGNLIFNSGSIQFTGSQRSDLNFSFAPSGAGELAIEADASGVMHISFKARGMFGGKADRKTVRIYTRRAFVRPGGKSGLACTNFLCGNETETIRQILARQIPGNLVRRDEKSFSAVTLPAANFIEYHKQHFSISLPDNWETPGNSNNLLLASPAGGYAHIQNRLNFSHGVQVIVSPSNSLNLAEATDTFVNGILNSNKNYSRIDAASDFQLPSGKALLTKLKGVGELQREESVNIYTFLLPSGNLFCLITIVPSEESEDFQPAFRRILNSVSFK